MKLRAGLFAGLLGAIAPGSGQLPDALRQFDRAEAKIVRLPPTAFPELPRKLVVELARRACGVPQSGLSKDRQNVIRGAFTMQGQTDWAVLCSVQGVSTILVFRNGSEKNPAAIATMPDRNYLQGITANEIEYSRGISAVGREFITRHSDAYGGPKLPPIDHQGSDDAFLEKGSATWYFHAGKWLQLAGSD